MARARPSRAQHAPGGERLMPTPDELFAGVRPADRTAPRVRMNFVESADGAATLDGRSGPLGGDTDRSAHAGASRDGRCRARRCRHGAGGRLWRGARRPRRTAPGGRGTLPAQPRLAVVLATLGLEPEDPFFAEAVARPIVVTSRRLPPTLRRGAEARRRVRVRPGHGRPAAAMRPLRRTRLTQVLSEGGPHLFGALLDADSSTSCASRSRRGS